MVNEMRGSGVVDVNTEHTPEEGTWRFIYLVMNTFKSWTELSLLNLNYAFKAAGLTTGSLQVRIVPKYDSPTRLASTGSVVDLLGRGSGPVGGDDSFFNVK